VRKIIEVHYNFIPNKEHPTGVSFGWYVVGEYEDVRGINSEIQEAKCEKIESFTDERGFFIRASFDNGVEVEQGNINKLVYTNEQQTKFSP